MATRAEANGDLCPDRRGKERGHTDERSDERCKQERNIQKYPYSDLDARPLNMAYFCQWQVFMACVNVISGCRSCHIRTTPRSMAGFGLLARVELPRPKRRGLYT